MATCTTGRPVKQPHPALRGSIECAVVAPQVLVERALVSPEGIGFECGDGIGRKDIVDVFATHDPWIE